MYAIRSYYGLEVDGAGVAVQLETTADTLPLALGVGEAEVQVQALFAFVPSVDKVLVLFHQHLFR